jgi:hypothetical protein
MLNVRKFLQPVLAAATMLLLAACASSGPTFSQANASVAPLAANNGRIYIYRESSMVGSAVQPSVKLDGVRVGDSIPGGYFYIDRPAGSYKISTSTEVERDLTLTLDAGQIRYVRTDISMGFLAGHVSPVLVEPAVAEKEIKDCHYTGQ